LPPLFAKLETAGGLMYNTPHVARRIGARHGDGGGARAAVFSTFAPTAPDIRMCLKQTFERFRRGGSAVFGSCEK